MKVSVSLPSEDVRFLDVYAEEQGLEVEVSGTPACCPVATGGGIERAVRGRLG